MSRYLLALMSALAVSACTYNNPQNSTPNSSDSTPRNEMDNKNSTNGSPTDRRGSSPANTTEIPSNRPSRTGQSDIPGMNDVGPNELQPTDRTGVPPLAADNGDRKDTPLTAGDQSESAADIKITQQIRQAVVADPELSTKAKNCTIVTIDGVVTLRGSVDTAAERLSIGSKVDRVSGVRRVDNNLKIMP